MSKAKMIYKYLESEVFGQSEKDCCLVLYQTGVVFGLTRPFIFCINQKDERGVFLCNDTSAII